MSTYKQTVNGIEWEMSTNAATWWQCSLAPQGYTIKATNKNSYKVKISNVSVPFATGDTSTTGGVYNNVGGISTGNGYAFEVTMSGGYTATAKVSNVITSMHKGSSATDQGSFQDHNPTKPNITLNGSCTVNAGASVTFKIFHKTTNNGSMCVGFTMGTHTHLVFGTNVTATVEKVTEYTKPGDPVIGYQLTGNNCFMYITNGANGNSNPVKQLQYSISKPGTTTGSQVQVVPMTMVGLKAIEIFTQPIYSYDKTHSQTSPPAYAYGNSVVGKPFIYVTAITHATYEPVTSNVVNKTIPLVNFRGTPKLTLEPNEFSISSPVTVNSDFLLSYTMPDLYIGDTHKTKNDHSIIALIMMWKCVKNGVTYTGTNVGSSRSIAFGTRYISDDILNIINNGKSESQKLDSIAGGKISVSVTPVVDILNSDVTPYNASSSYHFYGSTLNSSSISVDTIGKWKPLKGCYVNVNNVWKSVDTIYVKVSGSWKPVKATYIKNP